MPENETIEEVTTPIQGLRDQITVIEDELNGRTEYDYVEVLMNPSEFALFKEMVGVHEPQA